MPSAVLAFLVVLAQRPIAEEPAAPSPVAAPAFSGVERQLDVRPPRIEATIVVDGHLDEPAWRAAAVLTGFSQYAPVDGRPAEDSTQVLVWYSRSAIYFGIRAFEPHGAVHASLADRDRIAADDYVQIVLSTFNDGHRAFVFGVNPLGVQADGTITENEQTRNAEFTTGVSTRTPPDLSADFVYDSRGRLTDYGYEVEIRIPFKSLRFQQQREQSWGINVLRRVQHSGHLDTWAPARQANASFLAQSGALRDLADLDRGRVLDVTPEATAKADGGPGSGGSWAYGRHRPELGVTVRWGVTNNLTLNGTANPDFSQVESDAQQLVFDPRQPVFFSEKRPFFLDGIEQFSTPGNLIFTRRLLRPVTAVKLAGKIGGTNVALLSALDETDASASRIDHPVFNIARLKRDFGGQSQVGVVYTDREEGTLFNRVAGADAQILFGTIYTARAQLVTSVTGDSVGTRSGPLWEIGLDRDGRRFGVHYVVTGIADDFITASGAVRRVGIVHSNFMHALTRFGSRGALLESWETDLQLDWTWQYRRFLMRGNSQDQKIHLNSTVALRGGWQLTGSWFVEWFGYDSLLFADTYIERRIGSRTDTLPFIGTPHIPNNEWLLQVATPQFAQVSGRLLAFYGFDEDFLEWASARLWIVDAGIDIRPSDKLRIGTSYAFQGVERRSDGTTVFSRHLPRVKVEYQLARPLFVRLVGQYDSRFTDDLRDEGRTFAPLLRRAPGGTYSRLMRSRDNRLRGDWLFSYQPSPGTVLFAGYGSSLADTASPSLRSLGRQSDAFFVKASYLFRL
ncbi:MAG: hypothetical protein NVS4B3_05430 [Gemmatimonadaceae bacterium]